MSASARRYNVGGVFLPRPFKIRRLGHFGFNALNLAEGVEFYTKLLGFRLSDTLDFAKMPWMPADAHDMGDTRGYFMRYGSDHHAFVLFNKKVMDFRAAVEMYYRGFRDKPPLPQMPESAEVVEALNKGIDIFSGHRYQETMPARYEVEGVLLPQPFKITKIGPVGLFVADVDKAEAFYTQHLGFVPSEESVYRGARCVFLRCGTEHHSLGLFPKELRRTLGLSERTTCMSFGVELGSYEQLRQAVAFLKAHRMPVIDAIPPELYPGIDYSAFVLDPDGHCLQLYYYMEQVGWDGKVRPQSLRRPVQAEWPEAIEPLSDTYVDQVFQGPLG